MVRLPLLDESDGSRRGRQPFSTHTLSKHSRLRGATLTHSVCPYCAVGCSTNVYTKDGTVIDIEGNPNSPINQGTLCPKGANIFQLGTNPHRVKQVLYRAPRAKEWQVVDREWALDQVARRVKEARDKGYQSKTQDGRYFNAVTNIGSLGGATLDNEENYLMKKLFGGGLQILSIENQARI
jgi:formate dehydrogenase major subunit